MTKGILSSLQMKIGNYLPFHKIYFISLITIAIGLPLSRALMSIGIIALLTNWILEGNLLKKISEIQRKKSVLLVLSIYLIHLIGLIYTTDYHYALKDIRIKLPLVILPVVISTTPMLNLKQLKFLLLLFIASTLIGTLASTSVLFGIINYNFTDIREISLFISHIRFALLINVAIFSIIFLLAKSNKHINLPLTITGIILIIWFTIFLSLLQSLTGIIVFLISSTILFFLWTLKQKNTWKKILLLGIVSIIILLLICYMVYSVKQFYNVDPFQKQNLEAYTANGNKYTHNINDHALENGNYVWIYLCEKELKKQWNLLSKYKYDEKDQKDQSVKFTLIRYLTSKGLRKDSAGISKLTPEDIQAIESGKANYIYNKVGLSSKIYTLIWEIDMYKRTKNPSGHSVTQRIEFLKAGLGIIKNNFWIGVGTGDVQIAFDNQYKDMQSKLKPKFRLRAHNQYITFFITFGIFGFIWILLSLVLPGFIEKKYQCFLFLFFFIIAACSMLNEDTLETHAGITFFSFFYSLFLWGTKNDNIKISYNFL